MAMGHKNPIQKFGKFLSYVLGREPHAFGLVLDDQGYVKLRDLLKALNEEEGWRHIRIAHINELLVSLQEPPVEVNDNRIRAVDREHAPKCKPGKNLPKLLYACVRQKAHPFVLQNGLSPASGDHVVLSPDKDMALRLGRRMDPDPVLLTILVQNCLDNQMEFLSFGSLYLTGFIPTDCFTGPPPPKPREEKQHKEKPPERKIDPFAGSFLMDLTRTEKESPHKKIKKHGEPAWKQDRRRARRDKDKF
jgi:putative RNA 2'-phosphotransferase